MYKAILLVCALLVNVSLQDIHVKVSKGPDDAELTHLTVKSFSELAEYHDIIVENTTMPILKTGTIQNLPKLTALDLSECGIESIEENAFKDVPNLKILNLGDNKLTHVPKNVFNNLKIENLYLYKNDIATFDKECFDNMPELYLLDLSANEIPFIGIRGCHGCDKIHTMTLERNKITSVPAGAFGQMPLKHVQLSNNKINKIEAGAFANLKTLENLFLVNTELQEIKNDAFGGERPGLNLYLGKEDSARINTDDLTDKLKINVYVKDPTPP